MTVPMRPCVTVYCPRVFIHNGPRARPPGTRKSDDAKKRVAIPGVARRPGRKATPPAAKKSVATARHSGQPDKGHAPRAEGVEKGCDTPL